MDNGFRWGALQSDWAAVAAAKEAVQPLLPATLTHSEEALGQRAERLTQRVGVDHAALSVRGLLRRVLLLLLALQLGKQPMQCGDHSIALVQLSRPAQNLHDNKVMHTS